MADLALPPATLGDLYLARGSEVSRARPVMTGDVFSNVEIPGVEGGASLSLVLAHPCAMRAGAHLRSHVQMAAVRKGAPIKPEHWLGNFDTMPLPELIKANELKHRAEFELAGRVATAALDIGNRIACLDDQGIVLLLQRLAFHNTRFAVELPTMHESIAHVLEEANLLEEWVEYRADGAEVTRDLIEAAEEEFDALMLRHDPSSGITNRQKLRQDVTRASVRRLVREELRKLGPMR